MLPVSVPVEEAGLEAGRPHHEAHQAEHEAEQGQGEAAGGERCDVELGDDRVWNTYIVLEK